MKKVLLTLSIFVMVLTLTACGKDNTKLDLKEIKSEIEKIKVEEVSRVNIIGALSTSEYFETLTDVYDYDLKKYDITKANIKEADGMYDFSFAINKKKKSGYFIGIPTDDKLEKELDKVFKKYEYEKTNIGDYLVYVASKDNEAVLKLIGDNKYALMFNGFEYAEIETVLGKDSKDLVEEYLFALPSFMTSASQYLIVKPTDGNKDEVEEKMDEYLSDLQKQWDTYLPDQAELVKNRLETNVGDYLIYIISADNDLVLDIIKDNVEEE